MQLDNNTLRQLLTRDLLDLVIRVGLLTLVLVLCVKVFSPFAGLMTWALILAVALYPLNRRFAERLGGRQGRASTLLVIAALVLIGVPTVMLGSSFASHIFDVYRAFESDTLTIKQPHASVAEWPLIGKKIYTAWSTAAENLPEFLSAHQAQLKELAGRALSVARNTASSLLQILGSLIVAGIMMAYAESGGRVLQRIFVRIAGRTRGAKLHSLSTATIRSVATGVVGVAFIQALLIGIGFLMAGIPAAGVLALVVLVVGILQLPALIVTLPAIAYVWMAGDGSTALNLFFSLYLLVAGMADGVLKPMLLGRGVDAPMPIILLGALGGMISGGIIGLFVGAVVLAIGYQLFMEWLDQAEANDRDGVEEMGTGEEQAEAGE